MTRGLLVILMLVGAMAIPAGAQPQLAPPSEQEKWQNFTSETFAPFLALSSAVTAGVSEVSQADPKYGEGAIPLAERFGAATADGITQNFFSDYVMASILHQDTRYIRKGEGYGFWSRFAHAVTRSLVTRSDSGERAFNWSNVIGCGISAGISNAYYPPQSRTLNANIINWANSIGASGFGNLFPEFLPDFKRWLKRHHL